MKKITMLFVGIGKYYYNDSKKHPNAYVFYEAKFRKDPVSQSMIDEEIRQVQATGMKCYRYGFISRSGFNTQPDEQTELITIAELFR